VSATRRFIAQNRVLSCGLLEPAEPLTAEIIPLVTTAPERGQYPLEVLQAFVVLHQEAIFNATNPLDGI
jgi:hypothetical protein